MVSGMNIHGNDLTIDKNNWVNGNIANIPFCASLDQLKDFISVVEKEIEKQKPKQTELLNE